MPPEQWADIPGVDGYQASNLGQIRRRGGDPLAQHADKDGYLRVTIRGRSRKVHRLVLFAFGMGPRPGQEVLHKNGRRSDNRLHNLRWGSKSANAVQRERDKRRAEAKSHGTFHSVQGL